MSSLEIQKVLGVVSFVLSLLPFEGQAGEFCDAHYTLDEKFRPGVWCAEFCCGGDAFKYCCPECGKSVFKNDSCISVENGPHRSSSESEIVGGVVAGLFMVIVILVVLVTYCGAKAKEGNQKKQERRRQNAGSPKIGLECPTVVVIEGQDGRTRVIKPPKHIDISRKKCRDSPRAGSSRRRSTEGPLSPRSEMRVPPSDVRRHSADAPRPGGKERGLSADVRRPSAMDARRATPKSDRSRPNKKHVVLSISNGHSASQKQTRGDRNKPRPGHAHRLHASSGLNRI
ncbi:uncharacterized protein LOC135502151 [Lineus longissimus]|uniref:uncharacterized protein LOC135502151 n=1 Tax=Lineus longissimus TaxID=88925 RepID=UPI002B4CCDEA